MGHAIPVRTDYTAGEVRRFAQRAKDLRRRDDTIYRALKTLGFSHMSARPKAYKQNAEAMDALKKTSPSVWRKSARSSHPAHR